jgi:hypothetical protein
MSADKLSYLPQTGPARLVVRVLHEGEQSTCLARVPADSPFRSHPPSSGAKGWTCTVPAMLAIEMAAQSAAALEPRPTAARGGASGDRFLVGVRAVKLHQTLLDADLDYVCRASLATVAPPLRIYRFEVSDQSGEPVAEGELSTFGDAS